jgi:ABC-type glycerol-3-phosphate transport system permease component
MNRRPFRRWLLLGIGVIATAALLLPVYWIFVTSVLPTSLVLSRDPPLLLPPRERQPRCLCRVVRAQADADLDRELGGS